MNRVLYVISCGINGKQYVGQTNNFKKRMRSHILGTKSSLIARAINKYGVNNFTFEIVGHYNDESIDEAEVNAIKELNTISPNGYNLESGGCANKKIHPEVIEKVRKALTGRIKGPHSEEHKRKIGEANKGKIITEESRNKMSIAHKGVKLTYKKIMSEETREKLRIANTGKPAYNKGKPMSEEQKLKLSLVHTGKICPNKGKSLNLSDEQRQKLRDSHIGKIISQEQKDKISKTLRDRFSKMTKEERQEFVKNTLGKGKQRPKKERKPRGKKPSKLIIDGIDTRKRIWSKETQKKRTEGLKRYHSNMTPEQKAEYSFKLRQRKLKLSKTGYIGVTQRKGEIRFRAAISLNGSMKHIGIFDTAIEAAKAYDAKAKELFGEFANLNFKNTNNTEEQSQ